MGAGQEDEAVVDLGRLVELQIHTEVTRIYFGMYNDLVTYQTPNMSERLKLASS